MSNIVELVKKEPLPADLLAAYLHGDLPAGKRTVELDMVYTVASVVRNIYNDMMIGTAIRTKPTEIGYLKVPKGGTVWKLLFGNNSFHQSHYPMIEVEYLGELKDPDGIRSMLDDKPAYELAMFNSVKGAIGWHTLNRLHRVFCVAAEANCSGYTKQNLYLNGVEFNRLRHVALINNTHAIMVSLYLPKNMVSLVRP